MVLPPRRRTQKEFIMEKKLDWKRPEIIAVIAAFAAGILVHLFGLVNVLQNYDNIIIQPIGYGISLHSGRWALFLLGQAVRVFFGAHNLPWLNGVLFILFVALTVGILVSVFDVKSGKLAALIGIIFITFPSAASTLLFKYTAHFDAFGLLLAVLAVWFLEKYRHGFIPAVLTIAFSLGIYQAYVPVTIAMFVLLLIRKVLTEDVKFGQLVLHGLYDCVVLLLGLIVYYLVMKLFLFRYNATLLPYQGIDQMGNISLAQLPLLIQKAFRDACAFPVSEYASIAQTGLLKFSYCAVWAVIIAMLVYIAIANKKKPGQVILLVLLCLVFPIAVNFVAVMCPDSLIYTLMVYSFALIPCIPLFFIEIFPKATGVSKKIQEALSRFSVCIALLIVISNGYMTNVNYTSLYYDTCQAENYINSIVTQVRLTEGFTPDKTWVPLGEINDPLFYGSWDNVTIYGGNAHSRKLVSSYGFDSWVDTYFGYSPIWASEEETRQLAGNDTVKAMPVWPSEGSIRVIDNYIVIKFGHQ